MRILLLVWLTLMSASSLSAATWRGIEPLRSTRSDVIKSFNQCSDQKEACTFTLNDEDVYILFSGALGQDDCAKALPQETVIFIERRSKSALNAIEVKFDEPSFTRTKLTTTWDLDSSHPHYVAYINRKNGLVVKTRNGTVVQMVYLASGDMPVGCTYYYNDPESYVELYQGHVPTATIDCESVTYPEEQPFTLTAYSDAPGKRGFEWSVNAGKIIGGQHTSTITIDAHGLSGNVIKVSAFVLNYDLGVSVGAECRLNIRKKQ